MTHHPPELEVFASILDAQSAPMRDAFNYLTVQAGKMCLTYC
jgi:hypothetical protein